MSIPVKNDWMKNAKVGIKGGGGKTQTVIQFKITNFSLSTLLVVVLLNKYFDKFCSDVGALLRMLLYL